MADSIRTKVRAGIKYGLGQITTANGYLIDIGDVHDELWDLNKIVNYPSSIITFGHEEYLNINENFPGLLMKKLPVDIITFIKNVNDIDEERNKLLASLEKYFMTYSYLPSTGVTACSIDVMMHGDDIFGFEETKDFGGIVNNIEVYYKQAMTDPTSSSPSAAVTPVSAYPNIIDISIRELLKNAIIYNIQQITTDGGYNYTMYTKDKECSPASMTEFPFVNILCGNETIQNFGRSTDHDFRLKKYVDFILECWSADINDPAGTRDKILADIEKMIMNNFYISDSNSKRTVYSCMFTYNEPFVLQGQRPLCGIDIGLRVWYHHNIVNPATVGG